MSEAYWQLHDRYQEKVNKCLVQGDEIKRLSEQNKILVDALEKIKKFNSTNFDIHSMPIDDIVDEALKAYKSIDK